MHLDLHLNSAFFTFMKLFVEYPSLKRRLCQPNLQKRFARQSDLYFNFLLSSS